MRYGKEKILWRETDPAGRDVKLTRDAYTHITKCHPAEAVLIETARETIRNPISIWRDKEEESKVWYYFNEIEKERSKLLGIEKLYIIVIVKKPDVEYSIASWYPYSTLSKKGAREIWKRR